MFTCVSPHHTLLVRIALQRTSYPLSLSSSTTHIHTHISLQDSLHFQQPHQHITNSMYISMCKHTLSLFHTEDLPARPSARAALPPMLETDISLSLSLSLSLSPPPLYCTRIHQPYSLSSHSLTHSLTLTYYSSSTYNTHAHTRTYSL